MGPPPAVVMWENAKLTFFSLLFKDLLILQVLPECIYVHSTNAWCHGGQKKASDPPGPGVTDGCEP